MGATVVQRPARAPAAGSAPPLVGLLGLPELFRYGMQAGLDSGGLQTALVSTPAELRAFAGGRERRVLVLPAARLSGVLALLGELSFLPLLALVVVVADGSAAEQLAALRARATGVLPPDADVGQALAVVVAALAGQTVLPVELARRLSLSRGLDPPPSLDAAQRAWLRALAGGSTVADLGRATGYSRREMHRRLTALYTRLGASGRVEALLRAERLGLLESGSPG